ncbi:type I restriction endonuclease subunit R [Macrococcus hajekii]|uniref:Type I restriction enzyme endonuclease subunit n=2 Tax=Macrococcus hajekii TaxID=198482 RepID=A0A4R6BNW9_9STAP|nr:type I restriction endonuclease subunit R [Macrococcus hajekii]
MVSGFDKDYAENIFQDRFVNELKKYKWEAPDFLNGNKQRVTVQDLIDHWRGELNRLNADQLEGVELTDNEFSQVMHKVNQISNSYEAAKLLAIEESKGKIDGIFRDRHPSVTREQVTLTIFKKAEVRGGDSSYRIAREVETDKNSRFDLVLLINGLPLINIEQKRTDKSLDEAYGQFIRYYKKGEYINNFMAFSQMMVIVSEIETRYFATPKSLKDFNKAFVFHWSDKDNKPMHDWKRIVENFLMIPMAHQMVGDYLVIDEARDEENRRHMLMRPYQVYALQAVERAVFGWDNETKQPHGGYVWHTTGSGKTITSFKTALFLSTRAGFDKVIFLVDRRELDNRTSENFKAYAAYESVDVDDTKATYVLKKQLKSAKSGIVVTTTFKLHSLVKDMIEQHDESLTDKKLIFIIDEAHRTTMGQMMGTIKSYFRKNGLFYGFTGTPLFDENNAKGKINEKSEVINTTEKLFGPKLHQYTIDEAIADGNVLGFHVDYINTGEFTGYDDLREKLIEAFLNEKPDQNENQLEREIYSLTEAEVEKLAVKHRVLIYQDETHIPRVVTRILDNWQNQSKNGEFNAILTVAYKNRVIAYYNEFKRQIAERKEKPNVAMTFSFGNENDPDQYDIDMIQSMFKDYAEFTGIEFFAGNKKKGEEAYFEDVVERATRGGSGRNPKNIDFVIVADQLLTGYDSKRLNTLYVDRRLELQGLIQAYSRTNRVFGNAKEFGTIINFQYPRLTQETVNEALELYGSGGTSSLALVELYETAVAMLRVKIDEMVETLTDPTEWAMLKRNKEDMEAFKQSYRRAAIQLNLVKQYYEYEWDDIQFGMTEHTWLKYVGAYKNLFPIDGQDDDPPYIVPLTGRTKLAGSQIIDAPYILSLIGDKITVENGVQTVDEETLRITYEQIQELSNMGDYQQAQLLESFVKEELVPGNLSSDVHFDYAFERWKEQIIQEEVNIFAKTWGVDSDILFQSVKSYSKLKPKEVPYIDDIISGKNFARAIDQSAGNALKHNMALRNKLAEWMNELNIKYY